MQKLKDSIKLEKSNDFDLLGAFNEALKDPKFKTLIDKLKLPYEELSKYTTVLEDCSIEYNHCLNCKNILDCKNKIKGYAYLPEIENKKIKFGYKMCKKNEKITKENKHLENVYCYNIPAQVRSAKMKEIITDDKNRFATIKWLNNFIKNYDSKKPGKGLYLYGSFGSGKTYLISAMFNELAKEGVKSAIIFWPEYLVNLKSSFGQSDYQEKIDKIKKVSLLLIDDIGAETTTAWSRDEVLCPIMQYRMQEGLPTFFTSNLDINMLEQHLATSKNGIEEVKARRVIERIDYLTEKIEMVSKNYRK
ncbi:MAG: primosomal protein DnaI [Lactobacillales bacterium]|nr:primosomal protein DnaI [Lactobacillales bacterium]